MAGDIPFRDVQRKLERHGWRLERISGSHHIFGGQGRQKVSIPVHGGKVKRVYDAAVDRAIRQLLKGAQGP